MGAVARTTAGRRVTKTRGSETGGSTGRKAIPLPPKLRWARPAVWTLADFAVSVSACEVAHANFGRAASQRPANGYTEPRSCSPDPGGYAARCRLSYSIEPRQHQDKLLFLHGVN